MYNLFFCLFDWFKNKYKIVFFMIALKVSCKKMNMKIKF